MIGILDFKNVLRIPSMQPMGLLITLTGFEPTQATFKLIYQLPGLCFQRRSLDSILLLGSGLIGLLGFNRRKK